MKLRLLHLVILQAFLFLEFHLSMAQPLSGTYSLPGTVNSTTVNNLTQLAALLNSSTVTGTAIFEFSSSYAGGETYPITFNQFSGTGNVIIRPNSAVSTTLTTSGLTSSNAFIDLSSVKKITFDGRPGGTGSTGKWQFQNTGTSSGNSYPTFRFINGASYDTLQYLTVQSSGTNTTANITLSTSTVSGGNSYNVIQYCNIGNYTAYPYNQVLSKGTAGSNANANNSILNNNIYNYQGYNNDPYGGVNIDPTGNGSNWNISGNSFYATGSIGNYWICGIYFFPGITSTGNIISGNYIGGQAPNCGVPGTPWTFPGYRGFTTIPDFNGVYVNAAATTISNNVIQNIKLTRTTTSSQTFCGINVAGGTATISNNLVGSATTANNVLAGSAGMVLGIRNGSTSAVTIDNNTVANLTSDFSNSPSTTTPAAICGIYVYNSGAVVGANTITNNKVFKLSTANNYNNNQYFPLSAPGGGTGSPDNLISNMTMVAGIFLQTAASNVTHTISKNTIHSLNSTLTGGTNRTHMAGIMDNTFGTNTVSNIDGNLIYGIWAPDTYGNSNSYYVTLTGIYMGYNQLGTHYITNNMIDLGYKTSDGSSVKKSIISGIWDNTAHNNTNLKLYCHHNSVYIGGSDNSPLNTYAFRRMLSYGSSVYDDLSVKNNIFFNNRSSTSSGKQYGTYINSMTNISSDYNDIYGTGTGYIFGGVGSGIGAGDHANLAFYQSANPGFEAHSFASDPQYISPATATPDLHVPSTSPIDMAGTSSATLAHDFDNLIRANNTPVDAGAAVTCASVVTASVSLAASQDTVCTGGQVTFTATPANGGSSPNYNFYLNGVSVQNGSSATYSYSNFNNNDSVKVVMTSNANCVSPVNSGSNTKIITISNSSTVPSVTLVPSQTTICAGTQATFTAYAVNGGVSPSYSFFKNGGAPVQSGSSNIYQTTTLNNNDSVWVVLTSNASCLATNTATSNKIKMTVNASVTPSVTLTSSSTNICAGTQVTFTATNPVNGGASPSYNFVKNGSSAQSGLSATYQTTALSNNDSVWVVMTSDANCASPTTYTSNKFRMTVNPVVTPTVSVTPAQTTICPNTLVTFTAAPTHGGTPTYNFYLNGNSVQTSTSPTYQNNTLSNNDSVWAVMTSTASCVTSSTATSNVAHVTVTSTVAPSIDISSSSTNICAGTQVTFTAINPVNGGGGPMYNFFKNGIPVQNSSSPSYQSSLLNNHDSLWVVITSNASCASPTTASSTKIYMTVNPTVIPSIDITSSSSDICAGGLVTFTAVNPVNSGGSPTYNFFKNSSSVQNSSSTSYQNSLLNNNDSVWVIMSSNENCVSPGSDTSNKIYMTVNPVVTPSVTVTPSQTTICPGTPVTFTANPTYGGNAAAYNFYLNGVSAQNGASNTYSNSSLNDHDSVFVVLTSSAVCATSPTATSSTTYITVTSNLTPSVSITPSSAISCTGTLVNFTAAAGNGGSSPVYNFYLNGVSVQNSAANSYSSSSLSNNDSVWVILTSNLSCASPATVTSAKVHMTIHAVPVPVIVQLGNDTLTTSAFASYQWLLDNNIIDNATSQTFVPTQDGSYSVYVTDDHDCGDTSTPVHFIYLSVNDISQDAAINLYPNPTSGDIKIQIDGINSKLLGIALYDVYGNLVRRINEGISANQYSSLLNISEYSSGIYFLRLQFNDASVTKRIELVK